MNLISTSTVGGWMHGSSLSWLLIDMRHPHQNAVLERVPNMYASMLWEGGWTVGKAYRKKIGKL